MLYSASFHIFNSAPFRSTSRRLVTWAPPSASPNCPTYPLLSSPRQTGSLWRVCWKSAGTRYVTGKVDLARGNVCIVVYLSCMKHLVYEVVVLLPDCVSWLRQSACWWRRWAGRQWSLVMVRSASPVWRRTRSSPASVTCWREYGATGCRLNRYRRAQVHKSIRTLC